MGIPYVTIAAIRGRAGDLTIPIINKDWSAEALEIVIATAPDESALVTLGVTPTLDATQTWEQVRDGQCIDITLYAPCGQDLAQLVNVTNLALTWAVGDFAPLPKGRVKGEPVTYYYEIRRTNDSATFVAGDFILAEGIL